MKCILLRKSLLVGAGLCAAALAPHIAQSATINFDVASDLLSFNQLGAADAASTDLGWSATSGTNGSGGVVHASTVPPQEDTTAVYTPVSFDLTSGLQHSVSIDFKTGTVPLSGSSNAVAMVGFLGATNTGFYSNTADAFIGGRVRHQSNGVDHMQSQTKISGTTANTVSPSNGGGPDIEFVSDNWYRLNMSITRDGVVANQFAYSLTLSNIGPTGTSAPVAVTNGTLAGNILNSDLYNDTTVYAAFRGVPAVLNGNVAFDNFTVTSVPEPASAMLLGLAMLGLLTARRKQGRARHRR